MGQPVELRATLNLTDDTSITDDDLVPYLKASDGNVSQAALRFTKAQAARAEYKKVTIRDVAEFYRSPQGTGRRTPDGCVVPLEDTRGGIARDGKGRPIVLSLGMQHGSAAEMQKQYGYIMERVEAHRAQGSDGPVRGACVVVEVRPREPGAPPSFRFPDRDVRTLFDMQRDIYPGSLYSVTHFCGLPRAVTWAFKLVRPFMRRETYESMVLKPNFSHLPSTIPRGSMLRQWGGELEFDIDEWLEWRAREEGVEDGLCPRGEGRRFDPKAAAAANEDAMADSLSAEGGISAASVIGGDAGGGDGDGTAPARMHGVLEKRGSGRGLFGTTRWKTKLVAASAEVGLVYFDSTDVSHKNKAARIVQLSEEGTRVERRAAASQFALVAPTREYLFAAATEAEAGQWVSALQECIEAAQQARAEMLAGSAEAPVSTTVEALSLS
jgi:hypothetical protein